MKRLLKGVLVRSLFRRQIQDLRALIRASAVHTQRPLVCEPGGGKVIVRAPHMDDEVLGYGGTIARHVMAAADVTVVFRALPAAQPRAAFAQFLFIAQWQSRHIFRKSSLPNDRAQPLTIDARSRCVPSAMFSANVASHRKTFCGT